MTNVNRDYRDLKDLKETLRIFFPLFIFFFSSIDRGERITPNQNRFSEKILIH